MLKTAKNPEGVPIEAFDQIRAGVKGDRSQFYKDLSAPFYGANRPGSTVSQGVRDAFWLHEHAGRIPRGVRLYQSLFESEFTDDLKKFDVRRL